MSVLWQNWARRGPRWLACLGWACLLACAHEDGAEEEADKSEPPRLVGRVASVPSDGGFVLIQSYGAWGVADGQVVFSRSPDGRMANLLPTGERMSQFVAADIRGGQVAVGDAVYAEQKPKGDKVPE